MITVKHYRNGYAVATNERDKPVLGNRYFTGKDKPNYPVPAIYRVVDIHPLEIVVWKSTPQETWPGQDYRTMYIEHSY